MNKSKVHIKHGLILALIVIILSVIMNITGWYANDIASYSIYPAIIILIIIFCFQYKKVQDKAASFANIFAHGFKTACVAALMMIVWNLFSTKVLFKENADKIFEERKTEMIAQGADNSDVEKQAAFAQQNYVLLTISSTLLLYGVTGVVGSLLGAALAKKNKPD